MPNEQYFSYIYLGENMLHWMRWWWCPLCTRPETTVPR